MKITGQQVLPFPVGAVWDALLDPAVLVDTIPGCSRLATTGEHTYDMTVTAGVAAVRGTYDGTCALSDLHPHESLVMHLQGAGAPGTIDATVQVGFTALSPAETQVSYDADAVVGGMVGGVGQRMLTSVSRRMAGEFFGNVAGVLASGGVRPSAPAPAAAPAAPASTGEVFVASSPPAATSSQRDFLTGVAVGAGLVLLGVLAGSRFGRRR